MDTPKPRTEDDLRAAFALAAQQAPAAGHVLAKVNAAQRSREARRRSRGRWAPLAAVVAIGIVVGVPVTLIARHHSNGSSAASAGGADSAERAAAASAPHNGFDAPSAAGGSSSSAASANSGAPPAANATSPTPGPLVANCTPSDVSLSLVWHRDASGLVGTLTATNTTSSACPLAVKPAIYPLGTDGRRLDVLDAQTTEGYAGPTQLAAGATTSSTAAWASWCGPAAGPKAEVDWGSGVAAVTVSGPTSPSCVTSGASGASNIVTTWFSPLS